MARYLRSVLQRDARAARRIVVVVPNASLSVRKGEIRLHQTLCRR